MLAALLTVAACVSAADPAPAGTGSPWAMGIQLAPETFGLSVKYQTSPDWTLQGVISPDSDSPSLTFRGLRTMRRQTYWQSYLFAGAAFGESDRFERDGHRSVITGGLGVEWGWQARNSALPPLFASLEFGLGFEDESGLNDDAQDGLILVVGAGLHYAF